MKTTNRITHLLSPEEIDALCGLPPASPVEPPKAAPTAPDFSHLHLDDDGGEWSPPSVLDRVQFAGLVVIDTCFWAGLLMLVLWWIGGEW